MPGQWIEAVHDRQELSYITLDMDSSVSPTYGAQEGTAWNGHFGCNCYHLLFIFNQFGHLERCALRNGNVHSADDWKAILTPVIARYAQSPFNLTPRLPLFPPNEFWTYCGFILGL